jgi:hypothetical protein
MIRSSVELVVVWLNNGLIGLVWVGLAVHILPSVLAAVSHFFLNLGHVNGTGSGNAVRWSDSRNETTITSKSSPPFVR